MHNISVYVSKQRTSLNVKVQCATPPCTHNRAAELSKNADFLAPNLRPPNIPNSTAMDYSILGML